MLTFEKLSYSNYSTVKKYFDACNKRYISAGADITCDLAFGTTFLWKDYYKTNFAVLGNSLILQITNGGIVMYSSPVGASDIPEMLEAVREYCHSRGEALYFCFVPEYDLHYYEECFDTVFSTVEEDWYDYVYEKYNLCEFPGRLYHRQKNHVNKFIKTYPGSKFVPITDENVSLVRAYAEEWYKRYSDGSAMSEAEEYALYDLLDNWDKCTDLTGGFVETARGISGFTVGETVGNTVYVHIEKAEHDKNGAYQFLSSGYLKSMDDSVKFVNREEDMGIEGLRKSKQALHPVKLLKKYTLYCC